MSEFQSMFRLKTPCSNCPFRRKGAINLAPGRLQGIIDALVRDDWSTFQCHKTVHHPKTGGHWHDDGQYQASGREAMCAGAAIYLEKLGRPTAPMRLGMVAGAYDRKAMMACQELVIDPEEENHDDEL